MAKNLSLAKDFSNRLEEKEFDHEGVGHIKMHSVSPNDSKEAVMLKKFYDKNYRPNYILGNPKLFNWQFQHNDKKVAALSLNGEIIAHQGYVPVVFSDGETDYKGFISASTMVDVDFRRKGLMTVLRSTVQDDYETAVSLGGSKQGVALYTSMGYRHYGDLIRLVAIVDPAKCDGIAQRPDKLKQTVTLAREDDSSIRPIKRFSEISDQLETLRNKILPPKTSFGVKRNAEFLDWRYTDHPIFDYQHYGLWQGNELKAITIFRKEKISEKSIPVIRMTELIGEGQDLRKLVQGSVLSQENSGDVAWIDWFCSHAKICEDLKPLGFLEPKDILPSVLPIFTKPVDYYKVSYPFLFWAKDEELHKQMPTIDKWYITKGDGDADRPN